MAGDDGDNGRLAQRDSWDSWQPQHRGERHCSVRKLAAAHYRVELRGAFRPGWLAQLSTRLSQIEVSIESAHARRRGDGQWLAEVDVLAGPGSNNLDSLPYLAMAD